MNNIYCKCGNSFDKKMFKEHLKHCIYIKDGYRDFDYTIFSSLKKNYSVNGLNIIKCLLENYIKLININIEKIKKAIDVNDNNKLNNVNKLIIKEDKDIKNNEFGNNLTIIKDNIMNDEDKNKFKEELKKQQSENEEYKKIMLVLYLIIV